MIIFYQRSSSFKGCLPSKVIFHQSSSSIKIIFCQRSSSIKGWLPSGGRLPSKVVFHQRSSSVKGRPECGIAQLSLSLFLSSSWAPPMTSMTKLRDVIYFRPGPPQCPQWRRQRGPKIVNFCRTEGCCTKNWGRISPGFYWYHQK